LAENTRELRVDQIAGYDALIVLSPTVTATTLDGAERLTVIARFGVGYDSVDVAACTRRGVALTITPDGVRRPMATVGMTFLLALSQRLLEKDRLTRAGQGWERKLDFMGSGLTGRVLGSIGLGNIGRELFRLAAPFEMRHLAYDPFVTSEAAAEFGVDLVPDVETLLRSADFVVVNCALTPETHHLLNRDRLALMKPTTYLISIARGPIVDQAALTDALREGRIAGAGLDVFEREPVDPNDPLLTLDNVIVSPHALCWTDEFAFITGRSAIEAVVDVAHGRVPTYVVNKEVIETPLFQDKLRRYAAQAEGR
jgi:D-3-phosphoglycerate dehydrogenase